MPEAPQGTSHRLADPEVQAWIDDVHDAHLELSREGIEGAYDYTTDDGYRTMNSALRSEGELDPAVAQRIESTHTGIDQLPKYEGTTFRGTNLPQHVVDQINAGGPLRDPGFTSSSLDPKVTDNFMNPHAPNPTKITIEGHSGVDVKSFSAARSESEILFKGGTEFEVLRNVVDERGVRHLIVREVSR